MYTKKIIVLIISIIIIGGALIIYTHPIHTDKSQVHTEISDNTHQKETEKPTHEISSEEHPILDNHTITPTNAVSTSTDNNISNEISKDVTVYTVPVFATSTVLQAMRVFQDTSSDFSFSGREFSGLGFFVDSIGGKKSAQGFYWTLFINNKLANKGVSSAHVVPGDTILWRYQKGI